jgi:putative hydrolase of the HAD superfamily
MIKVDLKQFNTIIFDFGGVIFDINPDLTYKAFNKFIPSKTLDSIYKNTLLTEFEKGKISFDKLHSDINTIAETNISKADFKNAWNAMLLNYKTERIKYLQKLKNTHKLIMLSNTNKLHYDFFSKKLTGEFDIKLSDLFHKVYLSHEIGMVKPNTDIYEYVLSEQNIKAKETLFIEDTKENAIAADSIGINTLVIERNSNFYNYFI